MQVLLTRKGKEELRLQEVQLFIALMQVTQLELQGVQIPKYGARLPPGGQLDWQEPL